VCRQVYVFCLRTARGGVTLQWQLHHHLQGLQHPTAAAGSAIKRETLSAAATIQVRLEHCTWSMSACFGGVAMIGISQYITVPVELLATQDPLGCAAALGSAAASI
jgi:hypothetical protein